MGNNLTLLTVDGIVNIRVGAIIMKDGKVLMVRNPEGGWYYSVGGRICFGETAEQAVIREVREETGRELEIDYLGFINENFFRGDLGDNVERDIYELSFYFYMKTPADFESNRESLTDNGRPEYLEWVDLDTADIIYPEFFRTELKNPERTVKHIVIDERKLQEDTVK